MMRERYSRRKSIWRWLITVRPPCRRPAAGGSAWRIYDTSTPPPGSASIGPCGPWRARGSRHDPRDPRVRDGGLRRPGENDLAALDYVEPIGKVRDVMDVRLGDEER